ncbi:hypothetical protein JTE90_018442 [Oedothorax gibbosus]|uniref:FAD dependent oxidoreductase domain-containing protein n=1 Tax=Oedothorax gibbosus TaxID=931172 RepID=A0AAV6UXD2_9ARAC|nr:hypothetical protein JTE90_018442 [Oedothorax gibbosus]
MKKTILLIRMDDMYDVCIVGAGMFGSAAARHVSANPSLRVCLIGPDEPKTSEEWSTREIHSSHYDEGRIVRCTIDGAAMQHLGSTSIGRFRELERLSGIEFYQPVGTLLIHEKKSAELRNWLESVKTAKTPIVDLGSNDVFNKRYPFLQLEPDDHAFLDDSGAGYVSARRMVEAEQKVAMLQGCQIFRETICEVGELRNGMHQVMTDSGRVVRCKRVLVCAGAFTKFKGLVPNLKYSVHRETVAMLRVSEEESRRLSGMPPILKIKNRMGIMATSVHGVYILPPIQYPDGHFYLKIGPAGHQRDSLVNILEEARQWYNVENGDQELLHKLPEVLKDMIPGLSVESISSKTCVTCDSPSGLPYICRISPTVCVAAVGNGEGASVADEVGRLAADLVAGRGWSSHLPAELFQADFD